MRMLAVAVWPSQVTLTLPIPGLVVALMGHDHDTLPASSARFGRSPTAAFRCSPGVRYSASQETPGCVWADILARPAGWAPATDPITGRLRRRRTRSHDSPSCLR